MKRINNPALSKDAYIPADKFIFRKEKSENHVSSEAYSNWYKKLQWALEELGSKDFQKRVWVEGKGPEVSDFGEAACFYFDDLNLENINDMLDKGFLTKNEKNIILSFHDAYDKFLSLNREWFSKKITLEEIDSPEWSIITNLAQKTLQKLKKNNRK